MATLSHSNARKGVLTMSKDVLGDALRTVCGPLGDLNQKLAGTNGEEWLTALKKFLRKENPWGDQIIPVSIKLGVHKTADAYRKALTEAGYRIGDWADDILGKTAFTVASEETEVNLVVRSVEDLGFKKGAKYSEICARAQELGYQFCPAEVGPALRLAYESQPNGEWLLIAMEAIADSDGNLSIFYVGHGDDVRWLGADYSNPDDYWSSSLRFVFLGK